MVSPSPEARAGDAFSEFRAKLALISERVGEWAGIPMPLEGERLVIEPTYPNAEALMAMCGSTPDPDDSLDTDGTPLRVRTSFWSCHKRSRVIVMERPNGRVVYGISPGIHHLAHDLTTLGCSDAWGLHQESVALETLEARVTSRQFKQYLLTGMFVETSMRSSVTYLFRRLKPTVAISVRTNEVKILCVLCLHPIGYYRGSWAGAMCPTDDVLAHLMLMRGDEPMLWRRANQHHPVLPEAGL